MPKIENLNRKPFKGSERLLNVHRKEILYREDIKTAFGYSLVGIAASLAVAGLVYVVGKQLLK
jgi:hypothetical protein